MFKPTNINGTYKETKWLNLTLSNIWYINCQQELFSSIKSSLLYLTDLEKVDKVTKIIILNVFIEK